MNLNIFKFIENIIRMEPTFFETEIDFYKWLERNHETEKELLVGFYKVSSGKACMSWSQSVDQALIFGWIDGLRKSRDAESYTIRFTPRRPSSVWSPINIKKVELLLEQGLMKEVGLKLFLERKANPISVYSYNKIEVKFSIEFENAFKANQLAWENFQKMPPSFRNLASHWVMTAKQEKTRIKRMSELIADCEVGRNRWKY